MTYRIGTPVVGRNINKIMLIGAIVKTSPYGSDGGSYQIEWCDGYVDWYNQHETNNYVRKALDATGG